MGYSITQKRAAQGFKKEKLPQFAQIPQNLSTGTLDTRLDVVTHSLIATKTREAFVFAWLDISNKASRSFAQSLDKVPDDKIANAVFTVCV